MRPINDAQASARPHDHIDIDVDIDARPDYHLTGRDRDHQLGDDTEMDVGTGTDLGVGMGGVLPDPDAENRVPAPVAEAGPVRGRATPSPAGPAVLRPTSAARRAALGLPPQDESDTVSPPGGTGTRTGTGPSSLSPGVRFAGAMDAGQSTWRSAPAPARDDFEVYSPAPPSTSTAATGPSCTPSASHPRRTPPRAAAPAVSVPGGPPEIVDAFSASLLSRQLPSPSASP